VQLGHLPLKLLVTNKSVVSNKSKVRDLGSTSESLFFLLLLSVVLNEINGLDGGTCLLSSVSFL